MRLADCETGIEASEAFRRRLAEEVEWASHDKRSYSVIACVPQQLPGEGVAEVVQAAAACVHDLVRADDLPGHLTDEILAIGLPDTGDTGAQAVAHRLKSELGLRTAHLKSTVWEAGFACLTRHGSTSDELLQSAIRAAKTSRRGFAG